MCRPKGQFEMAMRLGGWTRSFPRIGCAPQRGPSLTGLQSPFSCAASSRRGVTATGPVRDGVVVDDGVSTWVTDYPETWVTWLDQTRTPTARLIANRIAGG